MSIAKDLPAKKAAVGKWVNGYSAYLFRQNKARESVKWALSPFTPFTLPFTIYKGLKCDN